MAVKSEVVYTKDEVDKNSLSVLLVFISGALVTGVVRRRRSEGVRREEGRVWEEISGRGARSGVRWRNWVPAYTCGKGVKLLTLPTRLACFYRQ